MRLAGATVLRGAMGFGKSSRLHVAKRFRISTDLPIVIEFVDSREKIEAFLPVVDTMMDSGLVTLERVEVINYTTAPPEHRHSRRWDGRARIKTSFKKFRRPQKALVGAFWRESDRWSGESS
jgi:hypothetical protein